ncbi:MAG: LysR family transcriptional regulator [Algiphilus sp.]
MAMRLSLDALRTLETIADAGNFARAAERLHRVPSALTYTVQKLESDYDLVLFERVGRRMQLTAAGQAVVDEARALLRHAEAAENRFRKLGEGWEARLTIAVDAMLRIEWLFPIVAAFDAKETRTALRLNEETLGGPWDALIEGRADIAVAGGEAPAGYGLSSSLLAEIAWDFACAPGHPLADIAARTAHPLTAATIRGFRAVVASDTARKLAARTSGVQEGQPILAVSGVLNKIRAQAAGLGIGFVPRHLAQPWFDDGRLLRIPVEVPRERTRLLVAWRSGEQGLALNWFRDALREDVALRAHLSCAPAGAS